MSSGSDTASGQRETSMAVSAQVDATARGERKGSAVPIERRLRLGSGLVLFTFVLLHLLNHALGIFGLDAMHAGQVWFTVVVSHPVVLVLLYGAGIVHIVLALKRALSRQTWRMPAPEAAQILLALCIPVLLVPHLTGTRIAFNLFGADLRYIAVLPNLDALWQTMLVIAAWGHGCIGVHYFLRHRRGYHRWRVAALLAAVLIPVLALAGFVAGDREASARTDRPEPPTEAERAQLARARMWMNGGLAGAGALALAYIGAGILRRRVARQIVIAYRGRGPVRVPKGVTVLEASRMNGVPHPSACGGRGRCATCRVHVLSDLAKLPEPNTIEQATLDRIRAPADVRLACQLRPTDRIALRILLPVLGRASGEITPEESREWAEERPATVLVLDLRAFNALVTAQKPYEIAVLVNRFRSEIIQAIRHHDGQVGYFYGDGLVAFFAGEHDRHDGARAAIAATLDIGRVLDEIDRELGSALALPIRAGLGLHTGPTLLARVGDDAASALPMALGPTVNVTQALQEATKQALADCLISEDTAKASGYDFSELAPRDVFVPGRDRPLKAYPIAECETLQALVTRKAAPEKAAREPEAAAEAST
jgi:adenylate cyclase